MTSKATTANLGLDLAGKFSCVSGGTHGIGAAIAIRLAKAGSSVIVIGRSEEGGNAVVSQLKEYGRPGADYHFVKADLSLVADVKSAAKEISKKAPKGIDFLFETAGKPPVDSFALTKEDHEKSYALQCLARFGLPYMLLQQNALKGSLTMIAAAGMGTGSVDVDDLELTANNRRNFTLMKRASRDSIVLDAVASDFARRHPSLRVSHMFPGLVSSRQRDLPFGVHHIYNLFGPIIKLTVGHSPEATAEGAVWMGCNPQAAAEAGQANFFSPWLGRWQASKHARDPANCKAIFDKLAEVVDKA